MKPANRRFATVLLGLFALLVHMEANAQVSVGDDRTVNLPPPPNPAPSSRAPDASNPTPGTVMRLTRTQAEQVAIKNNPRISVGHLLAVAQHQVYRETRAAEMPTVNGTITAVEAKEGSRIGIGSLNAPRLLVHAGGGIEFSQLITDLGRTMNLVASSKLQEKAQNARALATTEDHRSCHGPSLLQCAAGSGLAQSRATNRCDSAIGREASKRNDEQFP